MQGLTIASLKKNPSLIPLYGFMALGAALAALYTGRLALKNPDVSWSKGSDSNEAYRNKQYKFYNARGVDWSTYECPAPDYMAEEAKE